MTHKRKAPMWARLKATKKELKALREVVIIMKIELQTEKTAAAHYENSYKWAMDELNTLNNRQTKLLALLNDYVKKNVEQGKRIEELTAQRGC